MPPIRIAIDLETTGLDAEKDAIIEIGCVSFRDGEIIDEWSTFVNPGRPIPQGITQLTGISDRDVVAAPPLGQIVGPLMRFVGGADLVAHNVAFDLGFLKAAGVSFPGAGLDTFELASIILPTQPSYSLGALVQHLDIVLNDAHRALADARATALLFSALEGAAANLPLATLIEINRLAAANSSWSLRPLFVEAEQRAARTTPLPAYQRRAVEWGELAPLLNKAALQQPVYAEELEPLEQPEALDVDALAAVLEPDGPLAAAFAGYEHRTPQIEMLRAVADAFNDADHLLIEAGTGTGKSLAYLLPAIVWAVQNRRRVVISTNTINLQDQLVSKDIPDLQAIFTRLGRDAAGSPHAAVFRQFAGKIAGLRVALMKGRSNYLCPRRLDVMRQRADLGDYDLRVLARVLVWLSQTTSGDRGDLFLPGVRDRAVWARLATESGVCTADRCLRSQGGRCFFYYNRRQAEAAHIIIVNHALLLSDVAAGNRVLPDYRHLIVDEAHHLEDATTNQLSFQAGQDDLERLLNDIALSQKAGQGGLLDDLQCRVNAGLPPDIQLSLEQHIREAQRLVERCRSRLGDFFSVLAQVIDVDKVHNKTYNQRLRLKSLRVQPDWSQVEIVWDEAGSPLYELSEALNRLGRGLGELNEAGISGLDELQAEFASLAEQVAETYEQINGAVADPDSGGIYWVQIAARNARLSIHSAPIHIGPRVEEHLFHQKDNVILTSATLRTGDNYHYIQERLHAYEANTVTVGSPFDYKESTLIYLPSDMDPPNSNYFRAQLEAAIRALAKVLGGRTLALFTSYSQLRRTADALGPDFAAAGLTLLQQGVGSSRGQLLDTFRRGPNTVLFGTRSFWEGVDVVGPALSGLVLTRLPFAVPSDPIVSARAETFDQPFYQYSVPDAILRFRQGFGRLIRTKQDRGVCLVLDNRITTKRYGQLFLDSLPECTVQRGPLSMMPKAARDWLAEKDG